MRLKERKNDDVDKSGNFAQIRARFSLIRTKDVYLLRFLWNDLDKVHCLELLLKQNYLISEGRDCFRNLFLQYYLYLFLSKIFEEC